MYLNILFVEDNEEDYIQIHRQISEFFTDKDEFDITIDGKNKFEDAYKAVDNPHVRYDLIISDTYRGEHKRGDAAVLKMVDDYRKNQRFCPLIICSSGVCPPELESSAFVNWIGKARPEDLDIALSEILELRVPQLSRELHDEIDRAAGGFLWEFLEKNWPNIMEQGFGASSLERLIRSRASMVMNDLIPGGGAYESVKNRHGLEYYIYPSLNHDYYNLGDIIRNNENKEDIRVILTPHCHLYIQEGKDAPKVDKVLTIKTKSAKKILSGQIEKEKESPTERKHKFLKKWARSPADTSHMPKGRHWYLPRFLEIPHLFCDLLEIESIELTSINTNYERLATLTPPYAEALQESFSSFYGSVGIPDIEPSSIVDLLE